MDLVSQVAPVQAERGNSRILHRWRGGMLDGIAVHGAIAGAGIDGVFKGPGHAEVIGEPEPKFKGQKQPFAGLVKPHNQNRRKEDLENEGTESKRARTKSPRPASAYPRAPLLHVIVEEKLIRMRTQPQGVMLFALGRDPHVEKVT